ncbi:Rab GTPase [Pelomyxa schiedti]|nr:Rab GTPase [Pelomyxa schiedti]
MGQCHGGEEQHHGRKPRNKLVTGLKVVLLGDVGTGKTAIVSRLTRDSFDPHSEATIGASFQVYNSSVDGKNVKMEIWDTAGQERFRSLTPMYYRQASAAIIVYAVDSKTSFDTLKQWVDELRVRAPSNIVLVLAANKTDLVKSRMVTPEMAQQYITELQTASTSAGATGGGPPLYVECSAKTGDNIKPLFDQLARRLTELVQAGVL